MPGVALASCGTGGLLGAVARLLVGATLLLAGASKLHRQPELAPLLHVLGIPRPLAVQRLAPVLSVCEIALGAWLLLGIAPSGALFAAAALFTTFTLVLVTALRRGYRGGCGCFGGHAERHVGYLGVSRTVLLGLAAAFAAARSAFVVDCTSAPVWVLPLNVVALAAAIFLAAVVVYLARGELQRLDKSNPARLR